MLNDVRCWPVSDQMIAYRQRHSHLSLLGHLQRVVHFDTEIAHAALPCMRLSRMGAVFLRLIRRHACLVFGEDQFDTPVRLASVRAVVTRDGEVLTLAERGDLTTCNIALISADCTDCARRSDSP